jgi:hypothetical protein
MTFADLRELRNEAKGPEVVWIVWAGGKAADFRDSRRLAAICLSVDMRSLGFRVAGRVIGIDGANFVSGL